MTAQDVETTIIRRLRLSQPPGYLKGNQEAIEEEISLYRRALARFGREVLEQAWVEAASRNEYRCWPTCAAILREAERLHAAARPKGQSRDALLERALELEDAYVARFMRTSRVAAKAREGRYEVSLKEYVRACSHVQAQYLVGIERPGYEHYVIFGKGERDRDAEQAWFDRQAEQARSGSIRVSVPRSLLETWKREAAQGEGRGR